MKPAVRLAGLWLLVLLSGVLYAVRGVGSALVAVATRALDGRSASIGTMAGRSAPRRNAPPARSANAKSAKRRGAHRPLTARAADLFMNCTAAAVQGWRTGAAEGRARHAEHIERIQQRREQRERQKTLPRPQPPAPQPAEPAAPATAPPGADVIPMRKAQPPMTMTTQVEASPSGEAIDYNTTLAALEELESAAGKIRAQVEAMTAGLSQALKNDPESLNKIMAVEEHAEHLGDAAKAARETFVARHADLHEAHAANPHAATSAFYNQG